MAERGAEAADLVVLIDDDADVRAIVRRMLEAQGFEVVEAATAIAGLELVQRLPDVFQLVIINLGLPGLSGAVVLETLRHFRPDLPVVCITGAVPTVPVAAPVCLQKPFSEEELEAQVRAALTGRSPWLDAPAPRASSAAVARAQARYAVSGDLVAAAMELARGMPPD